MEPSSPETSSRSLTAIPEYISRLALFENLDLKTKNNVSTQMCLLLFQNCLTTAGLHPALFRIPNLYLLSLRQNQITHLPHAIGQLKGLKHLLLFNNQLQFLPSEILDLQLEDLQLGANPLLKYAEVVEQKKAGCGEKSVAEKEASGESESTSTSSEAQEARSHQTRHLAPRKHTFKVPSLVELCTRRLLEPVVVPKVKSFSPTMTGVTIRRHFDPIKAQLNTARPAVAPPAHLLKPFLPLLQPASHQMRWLIKDFPESVNEPTSEIQTCSVCKAPCSEFAEERLEWKHEIAGHRMCAETDKENWVPILWRGCNANCLDFLECRQ